MSNTAANKIRHFQKFDKLSILTLLVMITKSVKIEISIDNKNNDRSKIIER